MSYEKICLNCHNSFNIPSIEKNATKFCCLNCRISFKKANKGNQQRQIPQKRMWDIRHKHPCKVCGKPCCWNAQYCKKCTPHKYNFKGGKRQDKEGYVYLWMPDHPRCKNRQRKYIQEHVFIWEQVNNKLLPMGWIIHHLNGIKFDNRINNLIALPNRKHSLILQAKAKRIQELEGLLNNQQQLI